MPDPIVPVHAPIKDHPEFAPPESTKETVPGPAPAKLIEGPWKPEAKVSDAQLNDVIAQAKSVFKTKPPTFDQLVVVPNVTTPGHLEKRDGNKVTVRFGNGEKRDYDFNEIFDPRVAEQIAEHMGATAPAKSAPPPPTGPSKKTVVIIGAAIIGLSFLNSACETTAGGPQISGTAAANIRKVLTINEPEIRPLSALATDIGFAFAVKTGDRATVADAVSKITSVVAASASDTPAQFQAAVRPLLPAGAEYDTMAAGLTHIFELVKARFASNGDPQLLVRWLGHIAEGMNDSLSAWKTVSPSKVAAFQRYRANRIQIGLIVRR